MSVVARDSAGIEIVTHAPAAIQNAPHWTTDRTPHIQIGQVDGPDEYQLFRVTGVQVLPDGGVVVLNSGTHDVRWYDDRGRHIRTAGGRGAGPGEFESPDNLVPWPGESLAVWDGGLRRITLFGQQSYVTDFLVDSRIGDAKPLRMQGGSHLLVAERFVPFPPDVGFADGTLGVFRLGRSGALVDTVGTYPWVRETRVPGFPTVSDAGIFGKATAFAAARDTYWIGENEAAELKQYDATGVLRRIVRWEAGDRTPTTDDVTAYKDRAVAAEPNEEGRRRRRRINAARVVADEFPVYSGLLVDAAEHVWVQSYVRPRMPESQPWLVFGPDGHLAGRLETPVDFSVREVGSDYVAGVHTDNLGVEHVRVFGLIRRTS